MAARVGIELSPTACRIVELSVHSALRDRSLQTRVRSYSVLPREGFETEKAFASLRRRAASVVVWGVRSDHRQVVVGRGRYEGMRSEAIAAVRDAGVETRGVIADLSPTSAVGKKGGRQPVLLALANAHDVSTALQPLLNAGVRIRSIVTPADALTTLARSREAFAVPGAIEAYVALEETATCVALVRDGALVSARELPWGFEDTARVGQETPRREDLAKRLADELTAFLAAVGAEESVALVAICGGLPNLRTMTAPLMERLDVEVEPLDSLFGIDAARLPDPPDDFREKAAEFRLAWAAAADRRPVVDLMRHRRRKARRAVAARAAIAAGVAAGIGLGWRAERSGWWQTTPTQTVKRTTPPAAPRRVAPAPAPGRPTESRPNAAAPPPSPSAPAAVTPRPAPPTEAVAKALPASPPPSAPITKSSPLPATPVAPARPSVTQPPAPTPSTPLPLVARTPPSSPPAVAATPRPTPIAPRPAPAPPVAAVTPRPREVAQPTRRVPAPPRAEIAIRAPAQPVVTPPAPPPAPAPRTPAPAAPREPRREEAARELPPARAAIEAPRVTAPAARSAPRVAEPPPLPFDASLGSILYSPDRKFAIVNGRIVGPGDEVNGARIVDITQNAVLLRDAQGRLRSLTLGGSGRN